MMGRQIAHKDAIRARRMACGGRGGLAVVAIDAFEPNADWRVPVDFDRVALAYQVGRGGLALVDTSDPRTRAVLDFYGLDALPVEAEGRFGDAVSGFVEIVREGDDWLVLHDAPDDDAGSRGDRGWGQATWMAPTTH